MKLRKSARLPRTVIGWYFLTFILFWSGVAVLGGSTAALHGNASLGGILIGGILIVISLVFFAAANLIVLLRVLGKSIAYGISEANTPTSQVD